MCPIVRDIEYTYEEVEKHDKAEDLWVIIDGKVYDVTKWRTKHPGGELIFMGVAGKDASVAYESFHDKSVSNRYLKAFEVGYIANYKKSSLSLAYQKLKEKIEEDGLYQTEYSYYYKLIIWYAFQYVVTISLLVSGNTGCIITGAFTLGFFWQQVAFLGHDCGHNAVTHDRLKDWWYGIFVTLFFGVSGQWWKRTHNIHHIYTNSIEWDPDVQHQPFQAVDSKMLSGYYSYYHKHWFNFDKVAQIFVRLQTFLFFPIMGLARNFLIAHSWIQMFDKSATVQYRKQEMMALAGYWVWYGQVLSQVPTWNLRIAVFLISMFVSGVLHLQITLSHFASPMQMGPTYSEKDDEHFQKVQMKTTTDWHCETWMDWFHGGLQFQVAHHLFPKIPRHNLRKVKYEYILPFCQENGLTYLTGAGFFSLIGVVVQKMQDQANQVKNGVKIPYKECLLKEFLDDSFMG